VSLWLRTAKQAKQPAATSHMYRCQTTSSYLGQPPMPKLHRHAYAFCHQQEKQDQSWTEQRTIANARHHRNSAAAQSDLRTAPGKEW
jgi:hypothetical protein